MFDFGTIVIRLAIVIAAIVSFTFAAAAAEPSASPAAADLLAAPVSVGDDDVENESAPVDPPVTKNSPGPQSVAAPAAITLRPVNASGLPCTGSLPSGPFAKCHD